LGLRAELRRIASGLHLDLDRVDFRDGWIKVVFSGDDATVFAEAVRRRFGEVPGKLEDLVRGRVYKGWITRRTGYGAYVDIGILWPRKDALYPLYACRAQLCDGYKLPMSKISETFGLVDGLPLRAWVERIEAGPKLYVRLSEAQEAELREWAELPFQRVLVVGALIEEVHSALEEAECRWDVTDIQSMSLTTHIAVCKIGTHAPGIIAKVGSLLRGAKLFAIFPRSEAN